MRRIARSSALITAALALHACAIGNVSGEREVSAEGEVIMRSAVRSAAVRMIESSPLITPERTIEVAAEIRDRIGEDRAITAGQMIETARAAIDFESLTAYERVLIEDILALAEARLEGRGVTVSARASEVLEWIESAARLAG